MGYFNDQIITKEGMSLFADSLANHTEVVFTRVEIGDGAYSISDISNISNATGLKALKGSFPVVDISTSHENIRIRAVISNTGVETGFYIKEVGIYAKRASEETDKLVAISLSVEDTVYLPKGEGRKVEIPLTDIIAFSGDGNFTIQYTGDAYVLLEAFEEYKEYMVQQLDNKMDKGDIDIKGGGIHVGNAAPDDTSLLWIDTGNGGVSKYHNGTAWVPTKAVWG